MQYSNSEKSKNYISRLEAFMSQEILPYEKTFMEQNRSTNKDGDWRNWETVPLMEELKAKAKSAGLWNLFLPDEEWGCGLTTSEYAPLAEIMGRVPFSAEVFNCNAPDTGNMELLFHFGSDEQKKQWLYPLLEGKIRSAFCMTEPDVASSDARNISASIDADGEHLILNGRKWWSTGIGHPDLKFLIFMGVTNPDNEPHKRHSMVLVPIESSGLTVERMLPVFGEYDPPAGHGEVHFENVRVPNSNLIHGFGKGFEIAQSRLGPGRIHHCMRAIGASERALELMINRGMQRNAFGKPILQLEGNASRIADARLAIEQARLLTLYAAWKIDTVGAKAAMTEISAIKVVAPNVLQTVVDQAIQIHGGQGLTHETPLTDLFIMARALRLADGPDEVHKSQIARREIAKYKN